MPKEKQIQSDFPLTIRADVSAGTFKRDARTVECVFASETPVSRMSWDGPVKEILDFSPSSVRMDRFNNGANLLDNHNKYGSVRDVLGVIEKAWISGRKGHALIRFADTEAGREVMELVADGILRNLSVGYSVYKYQITKKDGEVDIYRAMDWEPKEVSITQIPADFTAQIRQDGTEFINNNQINERMEEQDHGTQSPVTPTPAPAPEPVQVRTEPAAPTAPPVNTDQIRNEAVAAERTRAASIRTLCASHGMPEDFIARHITEGSSMDAVRASILEKLQNKQAAIDSARVNGPGEIEQRRDAMTAGIIMRISGRAKLNDQERSTGRQYAGLSFVRMAEQCLRSIGENPATLDNMAVIGRALSSSTSDFPVILENVMHRELTAAYDETEDTWSQFCRVGSVSDFRTHTRYRTGFLSRLQQVNENGEYQTVNIPDGEKSTIHAIKKGMLINLTREMLVNDDLDAFMRFPAEMGRAAKRTIELDVYDLLALNSNAGPTMSDSVAFFHTSSHGNLASSGTAITVASVDAARVAMRRQKDPSGKGYININPAILLCAVENGGTARVVNDAQYDVDSTKFQVPNKVRGLFSKVIDTPQLTGNAWYVFADPSRHAAFEVAFLNGNQSPYLEQKEMFKSDGIVWKVRHEYGTAGIDWRAGYRNPGA